MVSIIVITYNRSAMLKKTLLSIIEQDFPDIEIILVDDGSDDDTLAMVKSLDDLRIKYFNFGRIGNLSKLRNMGIQKAEGEYVAFCDDDDLWVRNKLNRQIMNLNEYDFICTNAHVIDINDKVIKEKYFDDISSSFEITNEFLLSQGNCILTSSCLVKKKVFREFNLNFDEFRFTNFCEDYELFIRMSNKCRIFFMDENLILKRSHQSVSGGLLNILKMLDTSIEILSLYNTAEDPQRKKLSTEGIVGFKILKTKYAFQKDIKSGISELLSTTCFILKPDVLPVFIDKKLKRKIRKIL